MADRILMIEDDAHLAAMVSEYLAGNGFEVTVAPRAERGLALFENGSFQAVLLDVMLPDLDGLEVCRRIRARKQLESVRLITMTARHNPEVVQQSLKAGAVACLAKPFEVQELLDLFRIPMALGARK